jgi:hypothetical protein
LAIPIIPSPKGAFCQWTTWGYTDNQGKEKHGCTDFGPSQVLYHSSQSTIAVMESGIYSCPRFSKLINAHVQTLLSLPPEMSHRALSSNRCHLFIFIFNALRPVAGIQRSSGRTRERHNLATFLVVLQGTQGL